MKNILSRILGLQGDNSRALFARKLGMRQQTVDNYLSGRQKPSLAFIHSICCNCGVSADWLLGFTDDRHGSAAPVADAAAAARIAALEQENARLREALDESRRAFTTLCETFAGGGISRRRPASASAGGQSA